MRTFICGALLSAWLLAQEKVDLYTINRIKNVAFQNSKVMENAFYLTDVYGPRLTGSPGIHAAAEWAERRFHEWGLSNARLETWGPFGRTWYCVRFAAHMKEPQYSPLIGFARPWSPGTNGTLTGDPVLAPIHTEADLEKFKGKLKGKIVLLEDARPSPLITAGLARKLTNEELAAEALAPDPSPESPFFAPIPRLPQPLPYPDYTGKEDREAARRWRNKVNKFLREEGVALTLIPGYGTDGGTVFATAAGSRELRDELPPPAVALTLEHYDRIARLIEKKTPVTLQFDIENRMENEEKDSFNVTAEIPAAGNTGKKGDEVVMLGAHLDSWTGGTGATDNAAGCAVTMEAVRILTTLKIDMPRTVRIALWTGEEQGLLGSKAYVKEHFADRETMELKPEHARLSGYFNLDN